MVNWGSTFFMPSFAAIFSVHARLMQQSASWWVVIRLRNPRPWPDHGGDVGVGPGSPASAASLHPVDPRQIGPARHPLGIDRPF